MEPMLHTAPTVNHGLLAESVRFILYRGTGALGRIRTQERGQGQKEGHRIVQYWVCRVVRDVMSRGLTSCHFAWCNIMSRGVTSCWRSVVRDVMSHSPWRHVTCCGVMSHGVMSCRVVCDVVSRGVALCSVVRDVISHSLWRHVTWLVTSCRVVGDVMSRVSRGYRFV